MTGSAYHAESMTESKHSPLKQMLAITPTNFIDINHDFALMRDGYHIRLADRQAESVRSRVGQLVRRMYSWRGLDTGQQTTHSEHPGQTTLVACKGDLLFGTLTVGVDSSQGLLADTLYSEALDEVRRSGARVCEVTRFAMDPSHSSPEVLASIFHLAFMITRLIHNMTDMFVEVHPRHTAFYRRMMGYRIAGPERICPRVGAPAVLMRLSLAHAEQEIRRLGGNDAARDRSLYRLFFSAAEQEHVLPNLRGSTSARLGT